MNTTQIHLTESERDALEHAADQTGWEIDADNDTCLELRCVGTGDLLGVWSAFILAVSRCDDSDNLADTLAESCRLTERDYRWWVEFPNIAPLES